MTDLDAERAFKDVLELHVIEVVSPVLCSCLDRACIHRTHLAICDDIAEWERGGVRADGSIDLKALGSKVARTYEVYLVLLTIARKCKVISIIDFLLPLKLFRLGYHEAALSLVKSLSRA